jgi:hypothetical protein
MPGTVGRDPLSLTGRFSDGTSHAWTMRQVANPALLADLLTGLAALMHPHGTIDKATTTYRYILSAKWMQRRLAESGFTGPAADLTRARLAEFWMSAGLAHEGKTRAMLAAFADTTGGLHANVRELIAGRPFTTQNTQPTPLAPYSEREWAQLRDAARRLVDASYRSHLDARAAAQRGGDPRAHGWDGRNIAWLLTRLGPSTSKDIAALVGFADSTVLQWGPLTATNEALFPQSDVVIGYRLLFGVHTGIVPDGIDSLGAHDLDWAGDRTILLNYLKGRTAKESLTLPRRAVRLLEQWLDHSALLRGFAPPDVAQGLWIRHSPKVAPVIRSGRALPETHQHWAQRHHLVADDGQPLSIHRHRIRTTFQTLRDRRAWFGSQRATIDPNHSPAVEGDHYLSVGTPTQRQAVDDIILTARRDLLRKAQPPKYLDPRDAASAATALPQLVSDLKLDTNAITELVGGQRDVFVAACADPLSGLHGPAGKPCPARPWVCLLCPLAVFTTRHAANLLRLKAFFARQGQQMTTAQYVAVFGTYASRIEEVLGCFDPAVLSAAATTVTDRDDELPLRPEESTW